MDPAYWQTVALAEQYEMLELMDWYEARKEQFNQSEKESDHEHCDFDHR